MTRRSPRFLDKGMRGWLVTMARKNYWRVAAWMDLDDLIAEGFLAYAICRAKYDDRVANKRHFMALVQITFINQITDLANDRTAQPEIAASQLGNPDDPEGDPRASRPEAEREGEVLHRPRRAGLRVARTADQRTARDGQYDGPPVSIEEMDEGIAAAVVARFERSRAK